jgi:hypothetical protein
LQASRRVTMQLFPERLVTGADVETTLERRFDDGAMRNFDGDVNR